MVTRKIFSRIIFRRPSASIRVCVCVCGTNNYHSRHRFWFISCHVSIVETTWQIGTSFYIVVSTSCTMVRKKTCRRHTRDPVPLGMDSGEHSVVYGVNVKLINWLCVLLLKRTHCISMSVRLWFSNWKDRGPRTTLFCMAKKKNKSTDRVLENCDYKIWQNVYYLSQ